MGEARMLAACRGEPVDATPVWFMRQAGRCLADYRQLRERYSILTLAKTPELCAQVTRMPDVAFGVEAIRLVREALNGRQAVIGFSGSPFTLACYLVEGRPSRDYAVAK